MASSEAKNNGRALGTQQQLTRQAAGDHADLKTMSTEVACVEIGLEGLGSKGTKKLQEKLVKTPKMTKAFCARIVEQYPQAKTEDLKIFGYITSGNYNKNCIKLLRNKRDKKARKSQLSSHYWTFAIKPANNFKS